MSTERLIVEADIAEIFLEKLAAKIKTIKAGSPDNTHNTFAYLESVESAQRIKALAEEAVAQGATLPVPLQIEGALMLPVVVNGITPEMKLYAQESFGPVVTMATFTSDAEALNLAKGIESGICYINGPTVHDEAQAPFGGSTNSRYGRFGSQSAINEFTEMRCITLQTEPRQYFL